MKSKFSFKYISVILVILIIFGQSLYNVEIMNTTIIKEDSYELNEELENKLENISVDDYEKPPNKVITLIKGCDDQIVNLGIVAFKSVLNDEIEVNYGNLIDLFNNTGIIIIFSHGTEAGIIINDFLFPWSNLALLFNYTAASYIYVAACCSEKLYNYKFNPNLRVVSLGIMSDVLLIGYSLGIMINIQYGQYIHATDDIKLFMQRWELINEKPECKLPLYCTSIEKIDEWAWIIPLHIASVWHHKLTYKEYIDLGGNMENFFNFILSILKNMLNKLLKDEQINTWLSLLLLFLLIQITIIAIIMKVSFDACNQNGAWISIEANALPPIGVWAQARNVDGNIILSLPLIGYGPDFGVILYFMLMLCYNNIPEIRFPSWICKQDIGQGAAEITSFPSEITVVPCEIEEISFTLKNIGPFQATYSLEVIGLEGIDVSILPTEITLNPGESSTIRLILHIPCDIQPQIIDFFVRVNYDGVEQVKKNCTLVILDIKPPNFDLYEKTILDNETFEYSVDILKSEGAQRVTANLFFQGILVGSDNFPETIDMVDRIRYIFEFPKPTILGDYMISISASDSFENTGTKESIIHYLDDDQYGPEILINPIVQTITDAQNNFSFEVLVSDPSDISSILVYYEGDLIGNSSGTYIVDSPRDIGFYTVYIEAIDNDNDRIEHDKAANFNITSLYIIDDDTTPPEINISYFGSETDGDPGNWLVNVEDIESNIAEINVYIDDILVGNKSGLYSVPNSLGEHTIEVNATNADLDRGFIDQEYNSLTHNLTIIDDDTNAPELLNLVVAPDIHNINISLDIIDQSGISEIKIYVNGELVIPISHYRVGNKQILILKNQWILKNDIYEVEIQVIDADNDRPNDALNSAIHGIFEITLEDMYNYVDWQLDELKAYINTNLDWIFCRKMNQKIFQAQNYLQEAYFLVKAGKIPYSLFYDKIAKIFLGITEFQTEIFSKIDRIDKEDANYIVSSLHDIRNNIVLLMGASVGKDHGYNTALIEVELLNLNDFIENKLNWWNSICLRAHISSVIKLVEFAIIELSMDYNITYLISMIQGKLELVKNEINWLFERGIISQEVADILLQKIEAIQTNIEILLINI